MNSTRRKMVLNVDLNSPPVMEEASDLMDWVPSGISVPINPQHTHPTGQQQGLDSTLIDVEAIEDEVEMLSSSRGLPRARNQSRRNEPVWIIDEDPEMNPRQSVVIIEEPVTRLSLNVQDKRETIRYLDLEEEINAKKKNVMQSQPEPAKVVPKEPSFNCPVCMNPLVEASSTICGHIFCKSCIKASIQAQKKCPTCRRKLNMGNFHRVYLPTTD